MSFLLASPGPPYQRCQAPLWWCLVRMPGSSLARQSVKPSSACASWCAHLRQVRRVASQIQDAGAEGRETLVARLPLHVAIVDLLNHGRDLEQREDLVIADPGGVAPRPLSIPLNDFARREIAGPVRDRRERVALLGWGGRRPVGEQNAAGHEW